MFFSLKNPPPFLYLCQSNRLAFLFSSPQFTLKNHQVEMKEPRTKSWIFFTAPHSTQVSRLTAELKRRGFNINHKRNSPFAKKRWDCGRYICESAFQYFRTPSGTQEVSVPLERLGNRSSESGMEYGYYLYRSQRTSGFCYCY